MWMVVLSEVLSRIARAWCPRPCRPASLIRLRHSLMLPTRVLKKLEDNLRVILLATSDPSKAWAQATPIQQEASRSKIGRRIWWVPQNNLKRRAKRFNRWLSSPMKKMSLLRLIQNSFQNNNWRKRRRWMLRSHPSKVLLTRKLAATWMPSLIRRPTWFLWTVSRRARNSRRISTTSLASSMESKRVWITRD